MCCPNADHCGDSQIYQRQIQASIGNHQGPHSTIQPRLVHTLYSRYNSIRIEYRNAPSENKAFPRYTRDRPSCFFGLATQIIHQPTSQTNRAPPKMLSSKTILLFLSAYALAAPAPAAAPGELTPAERVGSPDDPSWYCQWRHRVVFDAYTLEGRNWGSAVDESLLRKQIGIHGGWVTNWHYENNGDGVFRARVSFLMIFFVSSSLLLFDSVAIVLLISLMFLF
jgi:hypothetical protein